MSPWIVPIVLRPASTSIRVVLPAWREQQCVCVCVSVCVCVDKKGINICPHALPSPLFHLLSYTFHTTHTHTYAPIHAHPRPSRPSGPSKPRAPQTPRLRPRGEAACGYGRPAWERQEERGRRCEKEGGGNVIEVWRADEVGSQAYSISGH